MIDLPTDHPLLGRVVADSAVDPAGWAAARPYSIGASDAAKFSKITSAETYIRNKLTERTRPFGGSDFTRNGHAHEPGLMAYAGLVHNTRTYYHPDYPEFTATPDGYAWSPDARTLVLGEAKIKHHIVIGPTPAERRQVVFAQFVMGAELTKWIVQHLHPDTHRPYGDPLLIRIERDDDLLSGVLDIAHIVRDAMLAAREFEKGLPQ